MFKIEFTYVNAGDAADSELEFDEEPPPHALSRNPSNAKLVNVAKLFREDIFAISALGEFNLGANSEDKYGRLALLCRAICKLIFMIASIFNAKGPNIQYQYWSNNTDIEPLGS